MSETDDSLLGLAGLVILGGAFLGFLGGLSGGIVGAVGGAIGGAIVGAIGCLAFALIIIIISLIVACIIAIVGFVLALFISGLAGGIVAAIAGYLISGDNTSAIVGLIIGCFSAGAGKSLLEGRLHFSKEGRTLSAINIAGAIAGAVGGITTNETYRAMCIKMCTDLFTNNLGASATRDAATLRDIGTFTSYVASVIIGIIIGILVISILASIFKTILDRKRKARRIAESAMACQVNPDCASGSKLKDAKAAFNSKNYSKARTFANEASGLYNKEKPLLDRLDSDLRAARADGNAEALLNNTRSKIQASDFEEAEKLIGEAEAKIEFEKWEARLHQAEKSIKAAEGNGVKIPPSILALFEKTHNALNSGDYGKIDENVNLILEKVNDAEENHKKFKKAENEIKTARDKINSLKEIEISVKELEDLLSNAETSLQQENYDDAYALASRCVNDATDKSHRHSRSESEIGAARSELIRTTLHPDRMSELEGLLAKAEAAHDREDYDAAYTSAHETVINAIKLDKDRKEAEQKIESSKDKMERMESYGIEMSALNDLFARAEDSRAKGDYSDAISHASRCIDIASRTVDASKPEIVLTFPEGMQYNVWRRVKLTLENTGTMHARNVRIAISNAFEVRNLEIIEEIGVGEVAESEVSLRPTESGNVPVDYILEYSDHPNRDYKVEKTVLLNIRPSEGSQSDSAEDAAFGMGIDIRRGYEVLGNNDLRFGIRVINDTDFAIIDVQTILDYPQTLFSLRGGVVQSIGNISPGGKWVARYELTPLGCVHQEKLNAIVTYQDHTGRKRTVQIRPKEVHCVCPFLRENALTEGEFAELAARSESIDEGLSFSGIGVYEITDFVKESCSHRLYVIGEHEHDGRMILYLAGESIGEKAYYLLTTVVGDYKGVTQVALRAYSDKTHGLHGFLNEMTGSLRQLVGSVQSAKEIGIIESKQVVNIIDSVVSRTSFGDVGGSNDVDVIDSVVHRSDVGGSDAGGTGTGATSVNTKDSIVHRSQIGSAGRCPNCGKPVETDEKFCTECGGRVE